MSEKLDYEAPQYYRLMGQSPFAGTTLAALGSWAAVTVLASAYAYADLYIKVVDKLSILILIVFAVAMGFAVAGILRVTKVRNLLVAGLVAATAAVLALYVSWVVWEVAYLRRGGLPATPWGLFGRPDLVWEFARGINEEGTFRLSDRDVKGTELWLAWGIEALAIVGCTLLIPVLTLRRAAFCEECGSWCKKTGSLATLRLLDENLLREHVEEKDLEYLVRLGPPEPSNAAFHNVELVACPKCGQTNLLTVNRVTVSYNNGQRVENAKPVIDRLWLDPQEAELVRSLPQRLMAQAAAQPPAEAGGVAGAASSGLSGSDTAPPAGGSV